MVAAGPQRNSTRFPSYSAGFRGLLQREGLTDEAFQGGYLAACTNFHLIGRGRLKKRMGHKRLVAAVPSGANAVQGMAMYDFAVGRNLVTVVNGKIVVLNEAGSTWDDRTGALTISAGQDNLVSFAQFAQGSQGSFLCGTAPGSNALWKWSGSGNAVPMVATGNPGPAYASAIEEFYGSVWAVGTDDGNTACEWSDDGRCDLWPTGNVFHATRDSPAIGLRKHASGVLLLFHLTSTHRIVPLYDATTGDRFGRYVVDGSVGAISPYGIVASKGGVYFPSRQGFHVIRDPMSPAKYIGWPIEDYWNALNPARMQYMVGFERGEPWNEVVWLVSTGSNTTNDAAIVYNTELDAWSVFEGDLAFNVGCNWVKSTGKEVTVLGGYTGRISQAWGDDNLDTGNVDSGNDEANAIQTTFKTGFMEWGYPGLKRLREFWLDLQLSDSKTFLFSLKGGGEAVSQSQDIGSAGAAFGSFIFGTSKFSGNDPTQAKVKKSMKARLVQLQITESDDGPPYTLNAVRFWWRQSGRRLKAA